MGLGFLVLGFRFQGLGSKRRMERERRLEARSFKYMMM